MKTFLLTIAICLLGVVNTFAYIKHGDAKVKEGYTTTVELGSAYQETLRRATGINYRWSSSNTSLFTITSKDKNECTIRGLRAGTGKLYYDCSYFYDGYYRTMDFYFDVTVEAQEVKVTSITLNCTSLHLLTGETFRLEATVYPKNATIKGVNWVSSKGMVASVNDFGLVEANGVGTATITCYALDGSGVHRSCEVVVESPTTGVEDVASADDDTLFVENASVVFNSAVDVQVYDIAGRIEYSGRTQCIEGLPHGVHIIKYNGKTAKVVI